MPATLEEIASMMGHAPALRRHREAVDGYMLAHLRMPEIRALARLRAGFADLARQVGDGLLRLYREFVGATVTKVSPLLVRWCGLEGCDIDGLCWRLGPDKAWSPWLCGPRPSGSGKPAKGRVSWYEPTREEAAFHDLQRFAHSGVVVRSRSEPGAFGIRVLHDGLELGAFLGEARIRTFGAGGAVTIPGELPSTLIAACRAGRSTSSSSTRCSTVPAAW